MESSSALTLSQVAHVGRLTIKFGTIGLVALIFGRIFFSAAVDFWVAMNPPPPSPPTVGFGILPAIQFPTQTEQEKPKGYKLETPTGRFPYFGDRARVFLMVRSVPSLLADQRVKEIAANYGFVFQPTVLNTRTYRWTKTSPLQATLEMDTQNSTFSLTTNFLSRPELLTRKNLPGDDQAVQLVKSFIAAGQDLPEDIATASGHVSYLKSLGGELAPAVSFSDADFLQVDINRTPVDGNKEMYTPEGTKGIIHAVISGALSGRDQIVDLQYKYQTVDYNERHTYPLRSVDSAWQVLQAGEGFIAHKGVEEIAVIRSVYIGYFDSFEEQEYLQPIYVFAGDDGFLGYVSAIDPRFIQQTGTATR